jgi:hypothetical protein
MSRPIVRFHNSETDEIIDREMNDQEFAEWEANKIAKEASLKAESEAATAKTALLEKLGITEDEAKLLLS